MINKEIKALIELLDDPNEDVFRAVTDNLVNKGTNVIPELEKAWQNSDDHMHQERLEGIIQKIQYNQTLDAFKLWVQSGCGDLLEGTYLLARFQFPDLQFAEILRKIERIQKDVWIELNNNLTALEKIRILNHVIFDMHKFSRHSDDPYNPANFFIHRVLVTKKGNPASLAVIYTVIAQRLGLPVRGVNMPKNFILAWMDKYPAEELYDGEEVSILFYINPFNRGAVHSRREIENFLKEQNIPLHDAYFTPCSNLEIIDSMVTHLVHAYSRHNIQEKKDLYTRIKKILETGF